MTLLEVLVALGILAAGLASVAALMSAATTRLADATAIDRAGTLAANAQADLRTRGLLSVTAFPANTVISASTGRVLVIGDVFPAPFSSGTLKFTGTAASAIPTGTFSKSSIVIPATTLTLQDDVRLSGTTNTLFSNLDGISCGVTVVPTITGTVVAGTPVRVGVVVFKQQQTDWMLIPLKKISGGVFEVTTVGAGAAGARNESVRKRFLPACSWVFVPKLDQMAASRWMRIGSSWTTQKPDATGIVLPDRSFVSFTNADAEVVTAVATSGTLNVHAFTRVLRVDERPGMLE